MLAYVRSDIGMVRKSNEDNYAFAPPHLFLVADGMGGHLAGEVASSIAAKTITEYVKTHAAGNLAEMLAAAICEANLEIYRLAQSHADYNGMGTTVTAAYVEGEKIHWAHVGDSRMYLITSEQLRQVTDDHSLVGELVRNGSITPEEAINHPNRNILTRAVGTSEQIKVDSGVLSWNYGDRLLLCTDGLTNMLSEQEIIRIVKDRKTGGEVLDTLISQANTAGGADNITAILIYYGDA